MIDIRSAAGVAFFDPLHVPHVARVTILRKLEQTVKPIKTEGSKKTSGVQGEGDYASAREFNKAEKQFVASGRVPAAAKAAAPKSEAEQQEMIRAEEAGKRRAKK
jgi:hypothetical protein